MRVQQLIILKEQLAIRSTCTGYARAHVPRTAATRLRWTGTSPTDGPAQTRFKPCVSPTKSSIRTHTHTHANTHARTHHRHHNQRGSEQICRQTHSTFITCHLYSSTMNKTSGGILNAGSALKMQRAPPTGFLMSPIGRRSHVTQFASSVSCLPDTGGSAFTSRSC